jgi:hypothetical protein
MNLFQKITTIAKNTFREAVRDPMLYNPIQKFVLIYLYKEV